jgi:hypothetical protein
MDQVADAKLDLLQVCPQCTSALITTTNVGSVIEQVGKDTANTATCGACGWTGKVAELAGVPFKNPFGGGEQSVEQFGRDVLMTIVKDCAVPLGKLLIRWGFVGNKKVDKRKLSRYFAAVGKSVCTAIIEVRVKEEEEGRQ